MTTRSPKGQWPFDFVDIHGRPFGVGGQVEAPAPAPKAVPKAAARAAGVVPSRAAPASARQAPPKKAPRAAPEPQPGDARRAVAAAWPTVQVAPAARPSGAPAAAAVRTAPATDADLVFDALALAGWQRSKTSLAHWLRALGWATASGKAFDGPLLDQTLQRLAAAGRARPLAQGGWQAVPERAAGRLAELLRRPEARGWWRLWLWVAGGAYGPRERLPGWFEPRDPGEAQALLRLVLVSGIDDAAFMALLRGPLASTQGLHVVSDTLVELLRLELLPQVHRTVWWQLLGALDAHDGVGPRPDLRTWLEQHLADAPQGIASGLRLRVAEWRLHQGNTAGMAAALAGDASAAAFAPLLQAAARAHAGRFAEAVPAFAAAIKALSSQLGRKRGFAPLSLLQWYPLSQMAQADAAGWAAARKFCIAMSGSRTPDPQHGWGLWAHALCVRLGEVALDPEALGWRSPMGDPFPPWLLADRLLLAAWLDRVPEPWPPAAVQAAVKGLRQDGLPWKADLLAQACEQLGWPVPPRPDDAPPPWPVRFFTPRQEAWREALAAITALGGKREARDVGAAAPVLLQWRLHLDADRRVCDLEVFEPAASARGKPRPLSLLQLKRRAPLDPRDAAVARCLQPNPYRRNEFSFDLVAAALALQGHPAVVLDDAPGQPVELVEALPVLEVRRERLGAGQAQAVDEGQAGPQVKAKERAKDKAKDKATEKGPTPPAAPADDVGHFVFHLPDALLTRREPDLRDHLHHVEDFGAEAVRRDSLRVLRDAPDRARLVRVTAAHRRVAELVAQRWAVPASASAELDAALRVLTGLFLLHSDAAAGEPVPSDARLVAQLQPRGDALRLVLAVRPFGDFGPLQTPGQGRARLMTLRAGASLATERELAAERAYLAAVFEALPFLGASDGELPPDATWLLDEPEQALAAVHRLGELAAQQQAVRALEWPQGQPVRVLAPDDRAFASSLNTGRDWFALQGELALDEGRVLSLQQLLQLLRDAQGRRYIALGEGRYLLLAEQLRQRLAELDALAEAAGRGRDGGELRLHPQTAAWLAEAAPLLGLRGDDGWRRRVAALEAAAALEPTVPPGLQAGLRPYQHEGQAWMRRLAAAGFGAILADDMGLGKTVQTLALLLARADDGPALVVAPTSVCDNWAEELRRFAPALAPQVHGRAEGDRSLKLAEAGAGDVIVVSYGLLLRDADAFAGRRWATLVLDEAQALKNAATQRVQAVAALDAGFRLALSGTPVENRLADLWSIMNIVNPGLLGSESRFAERFGNPIERQRDEAARSRLRRLVSPFLLRRTKAQVLADLPPRTEIVMRIEPEAEERAVLEALRREALARIARLDGADAQKNRFNVLAELMRLRRAACDPRLALPDIGRPGAKLRAFETLAAELVASQHQTLVFSQFTDFLRLLGERLDARGLRWRLLDGSTPAAARAQRVAEFQRGEADFFLISLKAGGFGLNLTAADYVVIADPWWNPAAEDQAMGRAHRIGQQRPVTVYRLVTAGSIEERILALHHDKRELAEGLLAGQDSAAPLAAAELVQLLQDPG
jgi:superfamily II DNA or RNA helicase